MEYILVALFIGLSFALVGGGLLVSRLLTPRHPSPIKDAPYECGEETIGTSWSHFNIGYYLFALLFLVFDVEAAFLFPWALVLRDVGATGFIEAILFVLILLIALVYAWKKGVLEWV